MAARLRSDVHLAWIDEDIVVLDVGGDGYACMVGAAQSIRSTDVPGDLSVDPEWTAGLAASGLTSESASSFRRTALTPALGSLQIQNAPGLWARAKAIGHTVIAYGLFERSSFSRLIRSASNRRGSRRQESDDRLSEAVGAFVAAHAWIPFEGDCLKRSFALHYHLRSCGIDADWVFGVRTWPFLAHCWVQRDDLVVGDSLERISGFTPIMTVGWAPS